MGDNNQRLDNRIETTLLKVGKAEYLGGNAFGVLVSQGSREVSQIGFQGIKQISEAGSKPPDRIVESRNKANPTEKTGKF